ncbi:lycopene cyclase family protein [Streptomyces sp. CAU 1734]|uniref:lycopene cyclase family protein n=1 Tax=Streptomyces sp. CAU 1734 TaxID=3140360 RepID=UPI003260C8D1
MRSSAALTADVVIIGGGAAGLSLAHALAAPGRDPLGVLLIDAPDGPLRPSARTWCFWEDGEGPYDSAVVASWRRLRVRGPGGEPVECGLGPLRYKMLPSGDFERLVAERLAGHPGFRRIRAVAHEVRDTPDGAEVRCVTGGGRALTVRGRRVYDSRPPAAPPAARTRLLQHFRGWFVRTGAPVFDPDTVEFMDFRVPQPAHGAAFGYVLPLSPHDALVEYTEFSREPLSREAYEAALRQYTAEVLGLGDFTVRASEQGVIPMTDGRFSRRTGRAAFRIGTAGGATRPATGYTFAAAQRQAGAVARSLRRGEAGAVPAAHSRRALAMDAVLLRALDTGRVDAPEFFTGLFRRLPPERVLRFLDGGTGALEDIRIGFATPVRPMLRTALELPFLRRTAGARGGPG